MIRIGAACDETPYGVPHHAKGTFPDAGRYSVRFG